MDSSRDTPPTSRAPWQPPLPIPKIPLSIAPELKVLVQPVPPTGTIQELYHHFAKFGSIDFIRFDSRDSSRAYITFKPCPLMDFTNVAQTVKPGENGSYQLRVVPLTPHHSSLRSSHMSRPTNLWVYAANAHVGIPSAETSMTSLRYLDATIDHPIALHLNTGDAQELAIDFPAVLHGTRAQVQLRISLAYITSVILTKEVDHARYLSFKFQYPPKFLKLDIGTLPNDGSLQWSRYRAYTRITEIERYPRKPKDKTPLSLIKQSPYIDTGRWLVWCFQIVNPCNTSNVLDDLIRILKNYNTKIIEPGRFDIHTLSGPLVWHMFEREASAISAALFVQADNLSRSALKTFQAHANRFPALGFEVRYILDACLSKGLLYESTITKDFIVRLSLSETRAIDMLENLIAEGRSLFNPSDLFATSELQTRRKRRVPKNCCLMHSVTVTPTTMYVHPVQVEVSNRVIRKYEAYGDRFLRVRFSDEMYYGKIQSNAGDEIYSRIRRVLENGIDLAGRHYTFLACGNSQFRENGAYFFSPTKDLEIMGILAWMGYFDQIRNIPKYISRLGQCFSSTRAVTSMGTHPMVVEIPDIERNGFVFTDGVGKVSPLLAHMISQDLRLGYVGPSPEPPSAYQFRMGGRKGILVVDNTLSGRQIHTRPSQMKFPSNFNQLEIIRVSTFATACLNRLIILVLSTLGIKDDIFVKMTRRHLAQINNALDDDDGAIRLLRRNVDFNQMTLSMSSMLKAGLRHDPFVDSMMHLWRAWTMKRLKEKADLFVEQGAFLLGCVDETATLKMDPGLPEIFLQIPREGKYRVIKGRCIIARNPALHPGDVRVVQAVDCPKLHHLRDVVVMPQLGFRDLANMCSGGDLDGDDFLIMWDPQLIPVRDLEPMDYTPPLPSLAHGPITKVEMIQFFCDYMQNDSLGRIAVAHRTWADKLDDGIGSEKCLQLAQLHSLAVDYVKTGVPAQMTPELKVDLYPHWTGKPAGKTYRSVKVLGKLYDEVERVEFRPNYQCTFDQRILDAYPVDDDLLVHARTIKNEFDSDMRRIMTQYGIQTEFEVWSAFVMAHSREIQEYKFAEELGRLVNLLRNDYRELCCEAIDLPLHGASRNLDKLGPFVCASYRVTADEVLAFAMDEQSSRHHHDVSADGIRTPRPMPLMSFPWIFTDEIVAIATKGARGADGDRAAAVSSHGANQGSTSASAEQHLHGSGDNSSASSGHTDRADSLVPNTRKPEHSGLNPLGSTNTHITDERAGVVPTVQSINRMDLPCRPRSSNGTTEMPAQGYRDSKDGADDTDEDEEYDEGAEQLRKNGEATAFDKLAALLERI